MLPVTFTFFLLPNTLILAPFGTRGETRASYRPRQRVALHYRMLGMHSSFFLPFSDCFASATGLKKIFHVLVEFHPAEGTELQFIRDPPKCGRPLYRVSEIVLAVRTSEAKEHEQHATHESRKSKEHKWRQPSLLRLCADESSDAEREPADEPRQEDNASLLCKMISYSHFIPLNAHADGSSGDALGAASDDTYRACCSISRGFLHINDILILPESTTLSSINSS